MTAAIDRDTILGTLNEMPRCLLEKLNSKSGSFCRHEILLGIKKVVVVLYTLAPTRAFLPLAPAVMASSSPQKDLGTRTVVNLSNVDVAAQLDLDATLDPATAINLKRKIDLHLMPLMCLMYLITFADKTTLGQSAVLGIQCVSLSLSSAMVTQGDMARRSTDLNQTQFNWLGAIFYLSYLLFEYPQVLALQRFPIGKWMSLNIGIWAVALLAHAGCKSFGALFAVRFVLGMCEGAITPGFMIVTSMFYRHAEQTRRVGLWFLMNGVAIVFSGLISFGVLHARTPKLLPLMIITGMLTLFASVIFWLLFPDSPTTAWFLTERERVQAVLRIKTNQAGVENKHWKKEQFVEALSDPKVWVMALSAAVANLCNSLTNQRQIILNQFGFDLVQTTVIGCVDGVIETSQRFIGRGYAAGLMSIPALMGVLLVRELPSHDKVGLLLSYWASIFMFAPFVILLGWAGSLTAGHTKRTTTTAVILIAYAIGNAVGPFMWKDQYKPRNRVPWTVIAVCIAACTLLALVLRFMLDRENKRRKTEKRDDAYDHVYLARKEDGAYVLRLLDRAFLDLTDIQNKEFRYVL
ncbi:hypothetical protein CVT26_015447 [Gymnopilus dilepis]|uniref:Major facilitator superfamily (MFS) profile domain-containing protein n=1 Tax=Gymnopilus dilepis TaxID=231916 RepID=A0A409W4G2_9AGAR|nr:hypothetical protein CVT26_015447 [Gymnopilus dilepis]